MSEARLEHIEKMLAELVTTVGTIKTVVEEEREYNEKRFEQFDRRFEQMDRRFDEVMVELRDNKKEHQYMAMRIFQNEMDIQKLKEAYFDK